MSSDEYKTQRASIGWPKQRHTRLHLETPQALIHVETDHHDAQGRQVLYISISATQDDPATSMPYVVEMGAGPGQQGLSYDLARDADQRAGLGLRLVLADHRHTSATTGRVTWVGLAEECPDCVAEYTEGLLTYRPAAVLALLPIMKPHTEAAEAVLPEEE